VRILVVGDLHYDIPRCRQQVRQQAEWVCRQEADALIVVGDTASVDLSLFEEALGLFRGFAGRRMLVAGNHDLWTGPMGDSVKRYERDLPEVCRACGFEYLDRGPVLLGDVAVVGCVGWYDYTFRDESLGVPERFYRAKVGPGAARVVARYRSLLDEAEALDGEAIKVTAIWRDGQMVSLGMSDAEFVARQVEQLREHLEWCCGRAGRVIVAMHHLPLAEMAPRRDEPNWRFARAFLGSSLLGEAVLAYEQVSHVVCGHSHWPCSVEREGVRFINVGSGYRVKRCVEIDI